MTLDCHGDGLSGTVSLARSGVLERIAAFPAAESIGSFYAAITHYLGFKHHRHEGKVTGLAAYADPSVAYAEVQRMISYDPETGRVHTQLGFALYKTGKEQDAVDSFLEATRVDPLYADAHYRLGKIYEKRGELKQAGRAYKATVKAQADFSDAVLALDRVKKQLGEGE